MNIKRYVLASLAGFVVIFAFDFLVHGILLKEQYMQSAHLWRSDAEWADYSIFMTISQILTAFVLGLIFVKGYEHKGLGEGIRFGLLIGILFAAVNLGIYSYTPVSATIAVYWIGATVVKFLLVGLGFSAVYRS